MHCKYRVENVVGRFVRGLMLTFAPTFVLLCGCTKEEPQPKAEPASVYMKDPVYREAMATKRAERAALVSVRDGLVAALEARVVAMKAKMPTADDAAVKAELEKDPEWNSLVKRLEDANAAFDENRAATHALIGERISRKTISK